MNDKNQDENDREFSSVKEKDKKHPSEVTVKTKKGKKSPKDLNQCINLQDSLKYYSIG